MSENKSKLLNLVRENDNPSEAVVIAIEIISSYLRLHVSSPKPSPADLQESC